MTHPTPRPAHSLCCPGEPVSLLRDFTHSARLRPADEKLLSHQQRDRDVQDLEKREHKWSSTRSQPQRDPSAQKAAPAGPEIPAAARPGTQEVAPSSPGILHARFLPSRHRRTLALSVGHLNTCRKRSAASTQLEGRHRGPITHVQTQEDERHSLCGLTLPTPPQTPPWEVPASSAPGIGSPGPPAPSAPCTMAGGWEPCAPLGPLALVSGL